MVAAKRVLVVDDEEIVRESYRLALTDAGYRVRAVGNGRDALQACRSEKYDVLLADLRMPDMDGMEVSQAVRREFPEVRIIIITGYPSPESLAQAMRLGISDYLEKPIGPDRLSEATAAALTRPTKPVPLEVSEAPAGRKETAPLVAPPAPAPAPVASETEAAVAPSFWADLAVLLSVPLIGFAYYLLFPFIAIVVAIGVIGKEIAKLAGWANR